MPIDTPLAKLIAEQIRESGAISFRDFMELALYHPGLGYYTRPQARIGTKGDFYTASQVGPLFGWTVAHAIEKTFDESESSAPVLKGRKPARSALTVIEFGAGEGFLARDILEYFQYQNADYFERLRYIIVEESGSFRKRQRGVLSEEAKFLKHVAWSSAENLEQIDGIILANEFVDALPFHRVVRAEETFQEIFVDVTEDFCERRTDITSPRLAESVAGLVADWEEKAGESWPVNQQLEFSIGAVDWISSLAGILNKGTVFILDYGANAAELYRIGTRGTAKAFYRHQLSENFYEHIGEQDLTADVNFTALASAARAAGFHVEPLRTQAEFLLSNEIEKVVQWRAEALKLDDESARRSRRQILNLILPEAMGTRFKALVLRSRVD
ncbi:MAG: SAM-dependent methyltransferase [Acidobacteriia bacterium]|nr:SAM-dependent methyltransferase [Terriglobia bacterium]